MKMLLGVIATLSILSAVPAQADKFALFMGGGALPGQSSSIFDAGLDILQKKLSASHYGSTTVYGPNRPSAKYTPFTSDSAESSIASLLAKINLGQIKPGDQILIAIYSHGLPGSTASHDVETDNGGFNVDHLSALADLAAQKGIQLGILDMSCYSGSTLSLAARFPNTCVITGSNATEFADKEFTEGFFSSLNTGESLEDSFLKARPMADGTTIGNESPQISTHAGAEAEAAVSSLVNSLEESLQNGDVACLAPSSADLSWQSPAFKAVFDRLFNIDRSLAKKYQEAYARYQTKRQSILAAVDYYNQFEFIKIDGATYRLEDVSKQIKADREDLARHPDDQDARKDLQVQLAVQKAFDELVRKDPEFAYGATLMKYDGGFGNGGEKKDIILSDLAQRVLSFRRQLYLNSYRASGNEKEPCREFKF